MTADDIMASIDALLAIKDQLCGLPRGPERVTLLNRFTVRRAMVYKDLLTLSGPALLAWARDDTEGEGS